ncbi:ABC transporter permease [Pseudogemmatithrix spongiicola]|uniref:ABC transporter permease n=1 Tax=Pseudogemmatithrix spongiicola TaxID=3062599 RepID=A0AA49JZD6_9BACT|nr:ABC transporter permease [Gemmatimonadaceae bacterium 'strain 138']WKW14582.1 ABC transporter permease [Gemmatimonadaceae bacterium 'strain 318']
MQYRDVIGIAFAQIRGNPLRTFFTLLGIIVSVAFLIAVVAIIQGMNAYVKENIADAMVGTNAFQVRRTPIQVGLIDDELMSRIRKRPRVSPQDAEVVRAALPDAIAVSRQSGWPTPITEVLWRGRSVGGIFVFGITSEYQVVQDYSVQKGRPISDVDVSQRMAVTVLGTELAEKLFETVDPIGQEVRIAGQRYTVVGVNAPKGRVLGQSFDAYVLLPITRFEMQYGRRLTTTISVKVSDTADVGAMMARAEEAMRLAHRLRPGEENDFSIETSDALVSFWKNLTRILFAVIPAVVAIGIVVGGIVIMNIMLMAVNERTREIGIRKAVGARARDIERQFLVETVMLSALGGVIGVLAGWTFAFLVSAVSPLPARITWWSVAVALGLGAGIGVIFGVYPARRAARLDPVTAMRAE